MLPYLGFNIDISYIMVFEGMEYMLSSYIWYELRNIMKLSSI